MPAFYHRKTFFFLAVVYASFTKAQNNLPQLNDELAKKIVIKDMMFKAPYVDVDEWRDTPVRHRYVHGGFKDTETRFSFYLPPKEKYPGHFFQYITPFLDKI